MSDNLNPTRDQDARALSGGKEAADRGGIERKESAKHGIRTWTVPADAAGRVHRRLAVARRSAGDDHERTDSPDQAAVRPALRPRHQGLPELRGTLAALGLFALLIGLLVGISGLNVVNSYVGRDFMTAISGRDRAGFVRMAIVYVGVFAASTGVAVFQSFAEQRLGLLWRAWLTRRLITLYLDGRTYYWIKETGAVDNPDQRIAEDVKAFTATSLSFILIFLNGTFTIVAFAGVLWTISRLLFAVAVGYAALGSLLTVLLGRPLVGLNYRQLDREANFRTALNHVHEHADSVALLHWEGLVMAQLRRRLDELVDNYRRITSVNRNLGFFTTGYNYLIQIIPALVVAPMYINREVEFGVVTQSAMAFAQLLGAFSLVINQFQSISSFAAVTARLDALGGAVEHATAPDSSAIETIEDREHLAYERLTLRASDGEGALIKDLSVSISPGARLLVTGPNEAARVCLFRATAGLWHGGEGKITRPPLDAVLFLPQRPDLPPVTLRELLLEPGRAVPDDQILAALRRPVSGPSPSGPAGSTWSGTGSPSCRSPNSNCWSSPG